MIIFDRTKLVWTINIYVKNFQVRSVLEAPYVLLRVHVCVSVCDSYPLFLWVHISNTKVIFLE